MASEKITPKFLTAMNGKAVFAGDRLYSAWHGQADFVKDVWVDTCDGDVYFTFDHIGQAKVTSCVVIPVGSALDKR